MTIKSWGRVLAVTLVLLMVVFRQQTVKAICVPAQCTPANVDKDCYSGQHCTASCCVNDVTPPPPDDGSGDACSGPNDCGGGECCRGAVCRTDCGTTVPTGNSPSGWHDYSDCNISTGWACDADNYATPLEIHFYKDGPSGGGGTYIGSTTANVTREAGG